MDICHDHNLRKAVDAGPKPYGIRVSLPGNDPFRQVLGDDWETTHWYATQSERQAALVELASQHAFSRSGDRPALVFELIGQE